MPAGTILAIAVAAGTAVVTVLLTPWQVLRGRRLRNRNLSVTLFAVVHLRGNTVCLVACLLLWTGAGFDRRVKSPGSVRTPTAVLKMSLPILFGSAPGVVPVVVRGHENHGSVGTGDASAVGGGGPVLALSSSTWTSACLPTARVVRANVTPVCVAATTALS